MRWIYFFFALLIHIQISPIRSGFAQGIIKSGITSNNLVNENIPVLRKKIELLNKAIPDSAMPLAFAMKELAAAYHRTNMPDSALYFAKASLMRSKELNRLDLVLENSSILQKIYSDKKDWKNAAYYLKEEITAKDSINSNQINNELTRQQIKLEFKNKRDEDSLRNLMEQKEKDNMIFKQELLISEENNIRNIVIVSCTLLVLVGWWQYRLKFLKLQDRENQLKIEALETQQHLLRAQMNPHYIFNSLSSIQGMLLSNQIDLSKKYLQNFSSMIRAVLELSKKKHITLNEEIRNTKLYLENEKLRLGSKLNYEIHVDENISTRTLWIPPLIIQPFVENGIKHGIQHKETGGNIFIKVREENIFLICTIEDNGIGRKASKEINRQSLIKKSSISTELAIKRLSNKNYQNDISGEIFISDLYDDQGFASGTKIEIKIPYKTEKND